MEFSFYYSNILWQSGLESQGQITGDLQVLKVLVGRDGKLVIDFKTQTTFRGDLFYPQILGYCLLRLVQVHSLILFFFLNLLPPIIFNVVNLCWSGAEIVH